MHDVFISYSHCDAAFRTEVVEKLESAGIRCWYAPRDIQPGEEWADAMEAARIAAKVFADESDCPTEQNV